MSLPKDAKARKAVPICSGFFFYFPDAISAVAELSRIGNDQHNPGSPLHWDRSKSGDELDALSRHLLESGTIDIDGVRHSTKLAWRAMANLQKELERALQGSSSSAGEPTKTARSKPRKISDIQSEVVSPKSRGGKGRPR